MHCYANTFASEGMFYALFFPSGKQWEDIDAINYEIRSFVNMNSGHHVRLML